MGIALIVQFLLFLKSNFCPPHSDSIVEVKYTISKEKFEESMTACACSHQRKYEDAKNADTTNHER